MRLYSFHARADDPEGAEAISIREGFSWAAFLFGFFWALYHRLWWQAAGILAFVVAAEGGGALLSIHPVAVAGAIVAMKIFVGLEGNDWRRQRLAEQGIDLVAVTMGADRLEAERRFFDSGGAP